jgi:hypothetical protein
MRHPIGFFALSLLAGTLASCSSVDTGSTSTSSSNGQDPLTGALAKYQAQIAPLATAPTYTAATNKVNIALAAKELVVLSVRSVDKVLLINGAVLADTSGVAVPAASAKWISITGQEASDETVLIDVRNGTFATRASATSTTTGIDIALSTSGAGSDQVGILGSTGNDAFGCKVASTKAFVGIKTAISQDVWLKQSVGGITVDLNDGNDSYDQGDCATITAVYGGVGNDSITAGTVATTDDTYSGGAGTDTLSYANRTASVLVNLSSGTDGFDATLPFAMVQLAAGQTGEADTLVDDFETVTGTAKADTIIAGVNTNGYTLNGGAGDDSFITIPNTNTIVINGNDGIDTVDYSLRASGVTVTMGDATANDGEPGDKNNISATVENLIGTDDTTGYDKITGNALSNRIRPGLGDDVVIGGDGDDTMVAGGADGADVLDGDDSFSGGLGTDTVDYSSRIDIGTTDGVTVVLDGAVANDGTVTAGGTPSGYSGGGESDAIGVDVENIIGTVGDDALTGSAAVNSIWSLGGTDTIIGGAGNDNLDGNQYWDTANDCNPVTLACLDPLASPCNCSNMTKFVAKACDATVTCGADPLDVVSCTGGATLVDTCWKNIN